MASMLLFRQDDMPIGEDLTEVAVDEYGTSIRPMVPRGLSRRESSTGANTPSLLRESLSLEGSSEGSKQLMKLAAIKIEKVRRGVGIWKHSCLGLCAIPSYRPLRQTG